MGPLLELVLLATAYGVAITIAHPFRYSIILKTDT
jgi:hypothetical protein